MKHSPPYIDPMTHSCGAHGGAVSAADALCFALNIAPPNAINPCPFFPSPPSTCMSFTRPLFPRVFSDAIFNPWKDECRRGKNGITVLESLSIFSGMLLQAVNVGMLVDSGILEVGECDSGQFLPRKSLLFSVTFIFSTYTTRWWQLTFPVSHQDLTS